MQIPGRGESPALDEGSEAAAGVPVIPGSEITILTIDVDHFKRVKTRSVMLRRLGPAEDRGRNRAVHGCPGLGRALRK